jgi:integrase
LATLLLGRRLHPKVVSEMLGHTDVGITFDLYSHVTATMQHDAARNLDALFGGQAGSVEDEAADQPS